MIQTHFGEQWASVCLGGEYTLRQYLGEMKEPSPPAAFYAAARSSGDRVLVKLLPMDAANGEERLLLWRRTSHLRHPNLLRLLDCGRETQASAGGGCLYTVMEWPEERLSSALENGPLSEAEARDLLAAALDALRYLHAQGLVHGSLDVAHVVATGNVIKLATEDLREPDGVEFTPANDVRALGVLLYGALTGNEFVDGADLGALAEPFAQMIRNTVKADPADRWKIAEILNALQPVAQVVPETSPAESRASADARVAGAEQPLPPASLVRRAGPPKPPLWAWPVSLAAIVGCIALVVHTPAPKLRPNAPAPAPAVAPPETPPAVPAAAAPADSARAQTAAPHERTVWRVIAYTYATPRDARKKALDINRKWPFLEAEVFAPKGRNQPPYLVALGGRMNRLEAARVLEQARRRGLPRDTFMLNFSD